MTEVAPPLSFHHEQQVNQDKETLIMNKIHAMYQTLPPGWSKNNTTTNPSAAPFVHQDGRVSWKHPARDDMDRMIAEMVGHHGSLLVPPDQKMLIQRYRRMLSSGVPALAVEQRARLEGVDPIFIYAHDNDDIDKDGTTSTTGTAMKEITNEIKPKMIPSAVQKSNLKRFEKMLKAGISIKAVQQAASVQGVDISELLLTADKENSTSGNNNNNNSSSKHAIFELVPNKNQVTFDKTADLTRLVTKLVQTISKRASATVSLTVDMRILYHALGSLQGVQHSRNVYNSTTIQPNHDKKMSLVELRSKRKPFLELASSLGISAPTGWKEPVDIPGLDDLVQLVQQAYHKDLQVMDDQLRDGLYDFGSLAHLYQPGTRVIATNAFCAGVGTMCEVAWNRYEEGKTLFGISRSFKVCFHFLVAVGKHFTIAECIEGMEDFEGKRNIRQLSFVPLAAYSPEEAKTKIDQLEQRGRLYNEIATHQTYMEYEKGSFFGRSTSGGGVDPGANAHYSGGRIMVDIQGGFENGFSIGTGYDPMVMGIKYMYKEYMLHMRAQKDAHSKMAHGGGGDDHHGGKMILFETVPEDYLAMTWPSVIGFSFQSKVWGDVLVDGLRHIQYQEDVFDKIVLPPARKRMVKALVQHSCDAFNDVVRGKGEGSVFLLYGEPGVGKTLTAEGICEMLHKPLYTVSLGQLGSTAATLEKNLNGILTLCARWDALILLDEADIFLEKRSSTGSLERNAMVSVMLRLVEYFKGVLFLTSNRIDSLDPAFKTRITLALRYESLDFAARNQIWINLLNSSGLRAAIENGDINTEELAKSVLNGREIKNSIRLGMALAAEDGEPVSQKVLLETVAMLNEYNQQAASPDASYDSLTKKNGPRSVDV